jgi:hypothetical protein
MRFELSLPCEGCGIRDPVNVELMASWWEWRCEQCGYENALLSATEWTLGWRVFEKATSEYLAAGDYSTSIIFAAMAVEAELARMFFKWRKVDFIQEMIVGLRPPGNLLSDEELDEEYRGLGGTIAERIDRVAGLLDPQGIDAFAGATDLAERIDGEEFPSLSLGSLAADIQRTVFWPRNRILHAGFLDHSAEDARRVCNIVTLVLDLLKRMDAARSPRPSSP